MCEQCYELKTSLELFIEKQYEFYKSLGLTDSDARDAAKKDLEQHIDSLPVRIGRNLYVIYKQIG